MSRVPQNVADLREALKSVILAVTEPLSMTASDLLESVLLSDEKGNDEARDKEKRCLGDSKDEFLTGGQCLVIKRQKMNANTEQTKNIRTER